MAKVLLDTDILSGYLNGPDRNVIRRAADYAREQGVFSFYERSVGRTVLEMCRLPYNASRYIINS